MYLVSHVSILIDCVKCLILLLHIYSYVLVQKRSAEGGKQGSSIKKLKKDKVLGAAGKPVRSEGNAVSMAPRVKPELALPVMYIPNPCFIIFPFNIDINGLWMYVIDAAWALENKKPSCRSIDLNGEKFSNMKY